MKCWQNISRWLKPKTGFELQIVFRSKTLSNTIDLGHSAAAVAASNSFLALDKTWICAFSPQHLDRCLTTLAQTCRQGAWMHPGHKTRRLLILIPAESTGAELTGALSPGSQPGQARQGPRLFLTCWPGQSTAEGSVLIKAGFSWEVQQALS